MRKIWKWGNSGAAFGTAKKQDKPKKQSNTGLLKSLKELWKKAKCEGVL